MIDTLKSLAEDRAAAFAGSAIAYGTLQRGAVDVGTTNSFGARLFEIGSVTKTMTAAVLARCVELNLVNLKTRVMDFFKDDEFGHDVSHITIRELAAHTSGLPRLPPNLHPESFLDPYSEYSRADLLAALSGIEDRQLADARGKRVYSNFGFGVLGAILATAYGRSYECLLEEELFRPLGMRESFLATSLNLGIRAPSLSGRDSCGNLKLAWRFGDAFAPAGGVVSTIDDVMIFAKSVLEDKSWGLEASETWVTNKEIRWHNGRTSSHHAIVVLDLASRGASAALWDVAADLDDVCFKAMCVPSVSIAKKLKPSITTSSTFQRYVGSFKVDGGNMVVSVDANGLKVAAPLVGGTYDFKGDGVFTSRRQPFLELVFADNSADVRVVYVKMHGTTIMRGIRSV